MFVAIVLFSLFLSWFAPTFGFDDDLHVSNVSVPSKYSCFKKERQALLLFKASITDDQGGILSSWSRKDNNENCCKWRGVECSNQTGHVIKLDLHSPPYYVRNSWLIGKISPSLLQLPHLNYLDLSYNDFSYEPIPKFIGSLTKLKYLDLSACGFVGTIPSQLGNLSNLLYLDLSSLDLLVESIDWLSRLSLLEHLSIDRVDLSKAIHWVDTIKSLPLLSYVGLTGCQLSSNVYPSLSLINSSTSITTLDLAANGFTSSIYRWLFNLSTSLVNLTLSYNQLKGPIPEGFGQLTSLALLDLSHNQLQGLMSDGFGKLSSLTLLDLSHNQLQGLLPDGFGKLNSLTLLDLHDNQLKGPIPEDFGKMTSLAHLDLSHNQLKGPIPEDFGKLTSLALLDLSHNDDFGTVGITKSFGKLCSLQTLYLFNSNISGNLEDFLHNLSGCAEATLEVLSVDNNRLTGSLPDSILRFSSLKYLNLRANQLNGTVSKKLGTLSKLVTLDLASNSIQDVLQEAHFLNLSSLSLLDLSFNSLGLEVSSQWTPPFQLTHIDLKSCKIGPRFPVWIQTQKNLSYLDIANCGISDNIPIYFWDQDPGLTFINLSTNQIKGKVPNFPSKAGIYNYPVIDLSFNLFEGQIPQFPSSSIILNLNRNNFSGSLALLCQIIGIRILDLSYNLFTGDLPDCVMQFRSLEKLNLAHNGLTGKILTSPESLCNLETLNLYGNKFFGELPLSLKNCIFLRFLDLGENNFSGNVPSELVGNLQQLYALSLRSNKLSGIIPSQLCYLTELQILDLSWNNLSGRIPPCLNNITAMVNVDSSLQIPIHGIVTNFSTSQYLDFAVLNWQGKYIEFQKELGLLKMIDLSSNQLTGEIPEAITSLLGLIVLDLSRNKLRGKIPEEIGQLRLLLSLNLSRNQISGNIPASISMLSLLNNLDLSYNNFSGRIPTGTQLQSFDASSYVGNSGLCGLPLPLKCLGDELQPTTIAVDNGAVYKEDKDEFWKWFYIGAMSGFITGFWGICGALVLNRSCRHASFRFIDNSKDWVYVKMAICVTKLKR